MSQQDNHSSIAETSLVHGDPITDESRMVAFIIKSVALLINLYQIDKHFVWNDKKEERRRILNILYIVPIYGLCEFPFIFTHPDHLLHFRNIRDCYGPFAMYNFLVLCYEYLGGEEKARKNLIGRPVPASWLNGEKIYTDRFHRFCKFAVMQFCITRLVCAFIIFVKLHLWGDYRHGDWCDIGYICITVVTSMSAALALYALDIFTKAVRNYITPDPTLKLFVITSVIYVTFWQEEALYVLENVGVIASATDASGLPVLGAASYDFQCFLVAIELLGVSIAMWGAFSGPTYEPTGEARGEARRD